MTPTAPNPPAHEDVKHAISRNTLALVVGRVLYLGSRVALPPVILGYVSLEEYGIWASCFIVITYLGMSAFGITNVYIRYVAEYRARNDTEAINRLVTTGVGVTTAIGLGVIVILWFALPWVVDAFRISPDLHHTAVVLMFATCVTFVLDLTLGAFGQVLVGLQRIAAQTGVWVAASCLEAMVIVVLLVAGLGLWALPVAFAVRFLVGTAAYVVLCKRALPSLAIGWRYVDRSVLPLFYGYGAIVQLAGLLGIFLYSIEKLIAGVFIGVAATALFDVGEKFAVMVSGIPSSINQVFLPAVSHLHTLEQREQTRALYLRGSRYIAMIGGLLMAYLAAFAGAVIVGWLGAAAEYRDAAFILTVFSVAFHLHVVTGPGSAIYRGTGVPARELVYPATQLVLVLVSVGAGFLLVGRTVEVIAVTVAASMVLSSFVYEAYTNRYLGVPQRAFATQVILPALVPYGIGFALAVVLQPWFAAYPADRWAAFGSLITAGVLYGLIAPLVLYRGFCDAHERAALRGQLARALGGFLPRRWSPRGLAPGGVTP